MGTKEIKQKRNKMLAEKVMKAMEKRKFEAYYCETAEEAKKKLLSLMTPGSSVTWGGSATLRESGIVDAVKQENYEVYDRDTAESEEERQKIYRMAFLADYYLTSANAVSEDGVMVNVDGAANRVAAISFGPKNVIVVVGMNKITATQADAVNRARTQAAPLNQLRFMGNTPCSVTGSCADCLSEDCICCEILITRMSKIKNRIKFILVGEDMGY